MRADRTSAYYVSLSEHSRKTQWSHVGEGRGDYKQAAGWISLYSTWHVILQYGGVRYGYVVQYGVRCDRTEPDSVVQDRTG